MKQLCGTVTNPCTVKHSVRMESLVANLLNFPQGKNRVFNHSLFLSTVFFKNVGLYSKSNKKWSTYSIMFVPERITCVVHAIFTEVTAEPSKNLHFAPFHRCKKYWFRRYSRTLTWGMDPFRSALQWRLRGMETVKKDTKADSGSLLLPLPSRPLSGWLAVAVAAAVVWQKYKKGIQGELRRRRRPPPPHQLGRQPQRQLLPRTWGGKSYQSCPQGTCHGGKLSLAAGKKCRRRRTGGTGPHLRPGTAG